LVINNTQVTKPDPTLSWEDASHQFRQEVTALSIAHRNVFTFQCNLDNPLAVYEGMAECLGSTIPGMCYLSVPLAKSENNLHPAIIAKAQHAGRFFPGVTYDPRKAHHREGRINLTNNLQPQASWPAYNLRALTAEDSEVLIDVCFTYADYKALYPEKTQELMIVPPPFYNENLVPLSDYLTLNEEQLYGKIPYIWLMSDDQELHRAAIPNVWVVSCQERLDYWKFLQSLDNISTNQIKPENSEDADSGDAENLKQQQSPKEKSEEEMMQEAVKRVIAALLEDD
ncbi:MAG: hypothetical protein R3345_10125, partial [Fulvivirga sp.]|nr:hypothetical protein [Fulvivirga sp.]